MKPAKPGFGGLSQEDIAHLRDQCIRGVRTLREIHEPRIAGQILAYDGGAKPFVLRLVHQGDHEPAIPCLIGARRYIECARSASLQNMLGDLVAKQSSRRLCETDIDPAAPANARAR